ncbi:GNAT family N-acetyltransferase [Brachybacterium hainanense]|uniref:GNAT family N-acetyltransferase n=1 Tax=Brachybacterium hainanense TaxID=1541174 RepID=A0ABV6R638_9MICO
MSTTLRRCDARDVPRLAEMRRSRECWMRDRGIDQWEIGSLAATMIAEQVARGEWFRLHGPSEDLLAAARLLEADPEFWGADIGPALYVHALMVDVSAAGRGLGRRVLELAAKEAAARELSMLRLDCAPHLLPYYAAQGFVQVGVKEFPQFITVLLEQELGDDGS